MFCPDCEHENPSNVTKCEACGGDFYDGLLAQVETRQFDRFMANADLNSSVPASSQPLLLYLSNVKAPVGIIRRANLIIGRKDPDSKQRVDVDLAPYEGQALGVSRLHARLDANIAPPIITDLSSYNGTFVNDEQLLPDHPRELANGDKIRFGRLLATLYYKSE